MTQSYMARETELAKQPKAVPIFRHIADQVREDADFTADDVFQALWSVWNFEHAFDDVLDAGHLPLPEREQLLEECAAFVDAALAYGEREAAGVFKEHFLQALANAPLTPAEQDLAADALQVFAGNLVANPFFQCHADAHRSFLRMMIYRNIAGDAMAAGDNEFHRQLAPAVRCADVDFIVFVADLVGGWKLARTISDLRDYDKPD